MALHAKDSVRDRLEDDVYASVCGAGSGADAVPSASSATGSSP